MKTLAAIAVLGVITCRVHAGPEPLELDLYGNQQPPRMESMPDGMTPPPGDTIESTRFPPNRDVTDIPTTEEVLSPTRSKTITRTISRPSSYPQQEPVVIDPVVAPIINPRYRPYPHR